jgi:hypothetical protein
VKLRRHINKGKIVIYTKHYGDIFYCTGRPHFVIADREGNSYFYIIELKCILFDFCIYQF